MWCETGEETVLLYKIISATDCSVCYGVGYHGQGHIFENCIMTHYI